MSDTRSVGPLRQTEHGHGLGQRTGLLLQARRRCGALLHQCSVLLGDLVHLSHGLVDLADATALLQRGTRDLADGWYREPALSGLSYFVMSCGGAPFDVLKRYIEAQDRPAA